MQQDFTLQGEELLNLPSNAAQLQRNLPMRGQGKLAQQLQIARAGGGAQPAVAMFPKWHSSFCDCFSDTESCIDTFCCLPCQLSRQHQALMGSPDTCDLGFCLYAHCCPNLAIYVLRNAVLYKYEIWEAATCCYACQFPLCSACQVHRELSYRGCWPGGTLCGTTLPPLYRNEYAGTML